MQEQRPKRKGEDEEVMSVAGSINLSNTKSASINGYDFVAMDQTNLEPVRSLSRLDELAQEIRLLPKASEPQKYDLLRLMQRLKDQLAVVPTNRARDVERVCWRVESLVHEVDDETPDKAMVDGAGDGLERAAEYLVDVTPAVRATTADLVTHLKQLV